MQKEWVTVRDREERERDSSLTCQFVEDSGRRQVSMAETCPQILPRRRLLIRDGVSEKLDASDPGLSSPSPNGKRFTLTPNKKHPHRK